MRDIKKFLTKNIDPHPGLIVAAGLFAVMLITAIGGIAHYNSELSQKLSALEQQAARTKKTIAQSNADKKPLDEQSKTSDVGSTGQVSYLGADGSVIYESPSARPLQPNESSAASSAANPPAAQYISVNLSINSSFAGTVSLKADSDQCQVLKNALSQKIIWKLELDTTSKYGTGVEVINNLGQEGSVSLVYKVNNQSVQGCSHVRAENGDNVNWGTLGNI